MYGITATVRAVPTGACSKEQLTGTPTQRMIAMALFVLTFLVLVALASALGYVVDSRDSADWKPSTNGTRAPRWQ
jgi:hypothetical protein